MSGSRKLRTVFGVAVAAMLPLSFYLIAKGLSKDKIIMPRYYVAEGIGKDKAGKPDTAWHRAADLRGINQLGETVSLNGDLQGRLLAVNFIFTSCPDFCPRLSNSMALLQRAFTKSAKNNYDTIRVHLVSVSVDPERDSVPALRAFADRFGANHDRWWYINAPRAEVARYMRQDLGLAGGEGGGGAEDLHHSNSIVILDRDRYIRGVYNGLDSADIKRCADAIVLLSMEKKRTRTDRD